MVQHATRENTVQDEGQDDNRGERRATTENETTTNKAKQDACRLPTFKGGGMHILMNPAGIPRPGGGHRPGKGCPAKGCPAKAWPQKAPEIVADQRLSGKSLAPEGPGIDLVSEANSTGTK